MIVEIRRDLLGAAAPSGIPALTYGTASPYSVVGKLVSLDEQWIVVESNANKRVWIPRASVLLIQVEN